jgi:UDP-N-acetyl-D-galactosamine dehydrogenase
MVERIAVIGLGDAGLPLALALARKFAVVVGFDNDARRISELQLSLDRDGQPVGHVHEGKGLRLTSDAADLEGTTFFVVTPAGLGFPDLTPIEHACATVGRRLSPGSVVVFEATVYPGVTEDLCGPILERESGLTRGRDFGLAYSPERINPGDPDHTLEKVTKVVSAEDPETLDRVAAVYAAVVDAGVHRAPSIKLAEAAKVIENTQRDLNIALVNELAILFDRMGIRTRDVLAAAGTKWNFSHFKPGLVGGPGVGVDPQYLSMKARQLGYEPEVILAGRRINDGMGPYVAKKVVKLLIDADTRLRGARVGILGLGFKGDCADLCNSKVPGIREELRQFGIEAMVHDPLVGPADAFREHGIRLTTLDEMTGLDALVVAVAHQAYLGMAAGLQAMVRAGGVLVDLASVLEPAAVRPDVRYWSF